MQKHVLDCFNKALNSAICVISTKIKEKTVTANFSYPCLDCRPDRSSVSWRYMYIKKILSIEKVHEHWKNKQTEALIKITKFHLYSLLYFLTFFFQYVVFIVVGTGLLFMLIFHIGLKEPSRSCTFSGQVAVKGSKRRADNWIYWFKEIQFYQVCKKPLHF